jgi:HAD superfamily hydrolase (TIGR01509 family)
VIDTLLLDVGEVLQFPRAQFAAEMDHAYDWAHGYQAFQQELLHDPGEARSLVGDGRLIDVVERLLPRHVTGLSPGRFLDRWLTSNIELNEELLDLLPHLPFEQIFVVTNQEETRGGRIREIYQGRPGVTGILISHELGCAKPDRTFYEAVLAHVGRRPHECLFVDDQLSYIAGASAIGLNTLLYRDNEQLTGLDLGPRRSSGP